MNTKTITHLSIWTVTLAVFWLLLSGFLKPLLLGFGVLSVALVMILLRRMDRFDQHPEKPSVGLPSLNYALWLIKEVLFSSIQVAKVVWRRDKSLSPAVAKLPVDKVPEENRVLYANSITLTPGTLSIDIDDEHVTVHALEAESIEELKAGGMANKVAAVSGRKDS